MPTPSLSTLNPRRQASLLVRYLAAVTFMDGGLPAGPDGKIGAPSDRIVGHMMLGADGLLEAPVSPTAESIRAAAACPGTEAMAARGVLAGRIATMSARLERAIEGNDGQWMPTEIVTLFGSILGMVVDKYAAACERFERSPEVYLDFHHAHAGQNLEPSGRLAVSGHCRFADDTVHRSVVGLVVRDAGFDWQSACVLPYIFAHELLCHAFQGLVADERASAGVSLTRPVTDPDCAWSEGWMDTLAIWLVEEWLAQANDALPEWISLARTRIQGATLTLHSRRFWTDVGRTPFQMSRRKAASAAVDALTQAYCGAGQIAARQLVLAFSLSLNLALMPQAQRNALGDLIATSLAAAVDPEDVAIALTQFRLTGDWREMECRLKEIALS